MRFASTGLAVSGRLKTLLQRTGKAAPGRLEIRLQSTGEGCPVPAKYSHEFRLLTAPKKARSTSAGRRRSRERRTTPALQSATWPLAAECTYVVLPICVVQLFFSRPVWTARAVCWITRNTENSRPTLRMALGSGSGRKNSWVCRRPVGGNPSARDGYVSRSLDSGGGKRPGLVNLITALFRSPSFVPLCPPPPKFPTEQTRICSNRHNGSWRGVSRAILVVLSSPVVPKPLRVRSRSADRRGERSARGGRRIPVELRAFAGSPTNPGQRSRGRDRDSNQVRVRRAERAGREHVMRASSGRKQVGNPRKSESETERDRAPRQRAARAAAMPNDTAAVVAAILKGIADERALMRGLLGCLLGNAPVVAAQNDPRSPILDLVLAVLGGWAGGSGPPPVAPPPPPAPRPALPTIPASAVAWVRSPMTGELLPVLIPMMPMLAALPRPAFPAEWTVHASDAAASAPRRALSSPTPPLLACSTF